MELTASSTSLATSNATIDNGTLSRSSITAGKDIGSAVRPELICDPGVTCGSSAYWAGEECDNPGDIALDPYGQPLECQYVGSDEYGNPIFIWVEV